MDISKILQIIRPNASYSVNGETYEGLIWEAHNTSDKPSLVELEETWENLKNNVIWEFTRNKRNKLLQESDYTQLQDFDKDKEAWKTYRTALRNIPQVFGNPESVVWPTKPS